MNGDLWVRGCGQDRAARLLYGAMDSQRQGQTNQYQPEPERIVQTARGRTKGGGAAFWVPPPRPLRDDIRPVVF